MIKIIGYDPDQGRAWSHTYKMDVDGVELYLEFYSEGEEEQREWWDAAAGRRVLPEDGDTFEGDEEFYDEMERRTMEFQDAYRTELERLGVPELLQKAAKNAAAVANQGKAVPKVAANVTEKDWEF